MQGFWVKEHWRVFIFPRNSAILHCTVLFWCYASYFPDPLFLPLTLCSIRTLGSHLKIYAQFENYVVNLSKHCDKKKNKKLNLQTPVPRTKQKKTKHNKNQTKHNEMKRAVPQLFVHSSETRGLWLGTRRNMPMVLIWFLLILYSVARHTLLSSS